MLKLLAEQAMNASLVSLEIYLKYIKPSLIACVSSNFFPLVSGKEFVSMTTTGVLVKGWMFSGENMVCALYQLKSTPHHYRLTGTPLLCLYLH